VVVFKGNGGMLPTIRIGCAGWPLATRDQAHFPPGASHLARYAQVFNAVEVNSSFYRPHRPATWRRWCDTVPPGFQFSVKLPRTITHEARLEGAGELLRVFLDEVLNLGDHLGCLLVQLPPSLAFGPGAGRFLDDLRRLYAGPVVCEPRHASWFSRPVDAGLRERGIGRVAADPALTPRAHLPGGDRRLEYLRLHGSPRMYHDAYSPEILARIGQRLGRPATGTEARWVIFDNTAAGHATGNALALQGLSVALRAVL
jgi:uncharacterized protein YecE (DUF72 family)